MGFEESLRRFNRADFEDMQQMRDGIARLRAHLEADGTPVRLCHCDSYAPNFLLVTVGGQDVPDRLGVFRHVGSLRGTSVRSSPAPD